MSFPDRTDYLDPTGRRLSSTPAVSVTSAPPLTRSFAAVGPQTYAPVVLPRRRRRRMNPLWTAVLALLVGLVLAVPVVLLAGQRNGIKMLPHTPSAAEAKTACKSAIELEAQGRLQNAEQDAGDGVAANLAGVDIGEPVRTSSGFNVDGTIRYQVVSIFGQMPGSVYVTCEATISGSKLTTEVRNR